MNQNALSLKQFTYLMLASLAENSTIIDLKRPNIKICALPSNYKQCIENILCAPNKWKEMFSKLIDVETYFKDHFAWERELSKNMQQTLIELKKEIKYDLRSDNLLIEFTNFEVAGILNQFKRIRQCEMKHFSNLITSGMYQRWHQHEIFDHSAKAIAKMKEIKEKTKENETVIKPIIREKL